MMSWCGLQTIEGKAVALNCGAAKKVCPPACACLKVVRHGIARPLSHLRAF
jgi:hypothetical protein